MQVKTISVNYERKLNLGDYNSATVGMTLWADLDEGEDVEAAISTLQAAAKEAVKREALPLVGKADAQAREIFLGLPVEVQQAALKAAERERVEVPMTGGKARNGATIDGRPAGRNGNGSK